MKITALVGAQYGSEGKGVVAQYLADDYDYWVRTGGPNAGHSFVYQGKVLKMRCLPCGWTNRNAILILGPGAVIDPDVLFQELTWIENEYDPNIRSRVVVDYNATPLMMYHKIKEGGTRGPLHKRIGSTGTGVGAARADWLSRDIVDTQPFGEYVIEKKLSSAIRINDNTARELYGVRTAKSGSIMLEGTQGFGLSLTHGHWPYCTSHDTTAGQLAVDAGIPPRALTDVIMVARTFPIRVAGHSGPLANETTWPKLSAQIGREVSERTTVTNLVRRVGAWDEELVHRACIVNGPTSIALTFLDYMTPEDEGVTEFARLSDRSRAFIDYCERFFETPVTLVGTGFSAEKGWTCVDRTN